MKNVCILLTGKARSGKDTVAGELMAHGFQREALADYLRMVAVDFAPDAPIHELVNGGPAKDRLRPFLQELGSLVRKHFGGSPFAERLCRKYRQLAGGGYMLVVPDCRYEDEIKTFLTMLPADSWSVRVWAIDRPDCPSIGAAAAHESERFAERAVQDGWCNEVIHNDGTLAELRWRVAALMRDTLRGDA